MLVSLPHVTTVWILQDISAPIKKTNPYLDLENTRERPLLRFWKKNQAISDGFWKQIFHSTPKGTDCHSTQHPKSVLMKLICVGRNYAKHIEELQNDRPDAPVIFMKPDSCLGQKGQPFFIPDFPKIHHEVEVLVKINRIGKHIQTKFAHKYYDEIGLGLTLLLETCKANSKPKGCHGKKVF